MMRLPDQAPQHHLAFGDKAAVAPDQIAFANIAIAGDPGVARIADGDDGARDRQTRVS
jgi:hypothetical protein